MKFYVKKFIGARKVAKVPRCEEPLVGGGASRRVACEDGFVDDIHYFIADAFGAEAVGVGFRLNAIGEEEVYEVVFRVYPNADTGEPLVTVCH